MPGPTAASHRAASLRAAAAAAAPTPIIPTVRCQPLGAGCDSISTSAGGATGVKGLNAVDSADTATSLLPRATGGHRAARPGPVRGQRRRRRDQQHRRDPGVQHGAPAPIRTDLSRHDHGPHQPGMEQRRRSVVRVRFEQRWALVLHRDRLGESRGRAAARSPAASRRSPTRATRASR